jgi:leucyl-tRNA synthetase
MDGFACSSWYFLRFASPHEAERPFDPEAVARWLPVDTYVGGAEHAVMHLLYARFWTKVMFDAGLISFVEPFTELKNQGMLLSAADGLKMSKSRGNVVTPDEVVAKVGTDALRLCLVFMGPFTADVVWDDAGIRGLTRFLDRFWRLLQQRPATHAAIDEAFERQRHKVIKRMTYDMEQFRFNTAVAALMEYLNYLVEHQNVAIEQWQKASETFTLLLAPFAPFLSEEVWQTVLGHSQSVHRQAWPDYDEALTVEVQVTLMVQVNGKLRDRVMVAVDEADDKVQAAVLAAENVQRHLNGLPIRQVVIVPNRLVNIVV